MQTEINAIPAPSSDWLAGFVIDPEVNLVSTADYLVAESTSVSEIIYGDIGPACHRRGWCVLPQQRTGRRLPSIYRREAIKWGLYHEERPSAELVADWARVLYNENVAVVVGPPSGYVWAIDIDVTDFWLAASIEECAFRILGSTGFRRVGNAPKVALFYRAASPEDLPSNFSRHFVDEGGEAASEHALEIQAHGKMMTLYGRHHRTGKTFTWGGIQNPAMRGPETVPAVTRAQVDRFLSEVEGVRRFHGAARSTGGTVEFVDDGKVRRPRVMLGEFVRGEDGKVSDGREKYLFELAKNAVRANAGMTTTDEGQARLAAMITDEFLKTALLTKNWDARVVHEAPVKIRSAVQALRDGRIVPVAATVDKLEPKPAPVIVEAKGIRLTSGQEGGLHWLPTYDQRRPIKDIPIDLPDLTKRAELIIPATAKEAAARVAAEVDAEIGTFFRDKWEHGENAVTRLCSAPTGAGKTWRTIAARKRRKAETDAVEPVLALVPNYRNVKQMGADATKAGLDVVEFVGKARSGCIRKEEVVMLQKAGRSTAGLCSSPNPDHPDDRSMDIRCPAWEAGTCLYQRNVAAIPKADLVVAVHDYVTCALPANMADVAAVVIDESITGKLIKSFRMPLDVLLKPRGGIGSMTKAEKAEGLTDLDFTDARDEIADATVEAVKTGQDVADYFLAGDADESLRRRDLLERTIALCSRIQDLGEVTPKTSLARIQQMTAVKERAWILQEARFWRTVQNRVERRLIDRLAKAVANRNEGYEFKGKIHAHGSTDRRIHWERGATEESHGTLRVSWTSEHNFPETPILVLDASANVPLLSHVLKRDSIVHNPISTPLRLRTAHIVGNSFAKSSLLPRRGETADLQIYKARLVVELRSFISHVAMAHPVGGIVVCLPLALRQLIQDGWSAPKRVIWLHYGNTRGLNVAEACSAAIAIGCINPTLTQIDDIVAAIAFEAERQQAMLDPIGPYKTKDDERAGFKPAEARIWMRNGCLLRPKQNAVHGYYASIVLDQIRNQEHLQFVGRLRPIYRDAITTLYNVGSFIPESMIVDELLSWDDVVAHIGRGAEIARSYQGHVGVGEVEEEIAEGRKLAARISGDMKLRSAVFELRADGEVVYVPAHTPEIVERYIEEGYDVASRPEMGTFPEDYKDEYRITFAQEITMRDEVLAMAIEDGWRPVTGTRDWEWRDPCGANDWCLDVAVLAQVYRARLSAGLIARTVEPAETVAGPLADYAEA